MDWHEIGLAVIEAAVFLAVLASWTIAGYLVGALTGAL